MTLVFVPTVLIFGILLFFRSMKIVITLHIFFSTSLKLSFPHGYQRTSHGKHLSRHPGRKAIYLACILLHLAAVQQHLEPIGFWWKFEQPRPLILGQWRLLGQSTGRVFGFALLLPSGDLSLLTRQLPMVVLVVVEFGMVGLDTFEQEVRRLGEKRVNREREGIEIGR